MLSAREHELIAVEQRLREANRRLQDRLTASDRELLALRAEVGRLTPYEGMYHALLADAPLIERLRDRAAAAEARLAALTDPATGGPA